ncbi:hypothetical protein SAMN06265346_10558 [Flavobacterium hercynium]|nr:hypothetical protein SAMN06265346_10558 [Flavobacterium hercynium]
MCSTATMAQNDSRHQHFTEKIVSFSKPVQLVYSFVDNDGNGAVEFTNSRKQVLRFRLKNHKITILHGTIAYQLFYYQDGYLRRIETFDSNGNRAGERESHNEAAIEFVMEKPAVYEKKKKLIDDAEGNINMRDDKNEKIIRAKFFDEKNLPIGLLESTYISSKEYWDYCMRMYWP